MIEHFKAAAIAELQEIRQDIIDHDMPPGTKPEDYVKVYDEGITAIRKATTLHPILVALAKCSRNRNAVLRMMLVLIEPDADINAISKDLGWGL